MGIIYVAGLGPGAIDNIPHGTVELVEKGLPVYLRTARHPSVEFLRQKGLSFKSLDNLYEEADSFSTLYGRMVEFLVAEADRLQQVVYLVPGHPGVAERSVELLREESEKGTVEVHFGPGQSFIDELLLKLGVDPIEGLLWLDATSLRADILQPRAHTVIMQLYNQAIASQVKVLLSEVYGDEWEVTVARSIGLAGQELLARVPLYELDRGVAIDHLTTLYVPPQRSEALYGEWSELVDIVAALRSPDGCPWDKEQTHGSLRPYVIEEAYELAQAIDEGNLDELIEELGDVLLQVLLHSQIGRDEGEFQVRDVIRTLSAKLIRRHPHVFGEASAATAQDVVRHWERIKSEEKGQAARSLLDEVKKGQSPLKESRELQKKAAKAGFDWPDAAPVFAKLDEELHEFKASESDEERIREFGDVLFSVVNLGRHYGIDPEQALAYTNQKFRRRFLHIEQELRRRNLEVSGVELAILDEIWQNAKEKADSKQENAGLGTNSEQ